MRLWLALLLLSQVASSARAEEVGPRVACQFDIEYYFQFDDQKQVARDLRQACSQCEMDVRRESPEHQTIFVGYGPVLPDKIDHQFVERAQSLLARGQADSELVFIVKMKRKLTIEETVRFMEVGVRFYRSIPYNAFFVRANARTVGEIRQMEPVEWMGQLHASDKYPLDMRFEPELPVSVYTIVGDRPECRSDIESLGGRVIGCGIDGLYEYKWDVYDIVVDPSRVNEVASLWWVQWIRQLGQGAELEAVESGE